MFSFMLQPNDFIPYSIASEPTRSNCERGLWVGHVCFVFSLSTEITKRLLELPRTTRFITLEVI